VHVGPDRLSGLLRVGNECGEGLVPHSALGSTLLLRRRGDGARIGWGAVALLRPVLSLLGRPHLFCPCRTLPVPHWAVASTVTSFPIAVASAVDACLVDLIGVRPCMANRIDRRMRYGGFGGIDLSGFSFGVCAPLNIDDSIAIDIVGRMLVSVKKVVAEGSSAAINLSVANWRALGVGGVEWFHNFVLPLMRVRGRTIGLGGGAGVSYSGIADGHRLASVMVVSLPAAYVEIWVATGFAAYVLYGCCFSSLLKK